MNLVMHWKSFYLLSDHHQDDEPAVEGSTEQWSDGHFEEKLLQIYGQIVVLS